MFERTELADGPRVISARLRDSRSVSVAAYVLAGSRVEADDQAGAAPFLAHLTFKGTSAYPSTRALSEAIEGVGGSFNAATDRESTVYWARVPRREATRAIDVLGELICRPALDEGEIDRERSVIVEEIRGYLDDPAEYCQILFQQAMFGRGPLGREICGEESDIRGLVPGRILEFWATRYRPANTVVAVAGDIAHDEAVGLVGRAFGQGNGVAGGDDGGPPPPAARWPAPPPPTRRWALWAGRSGRATASPAGTPGRRRSRPASGSSWAGATRPRPSSASAFRPSAATTPTRGPCRSSTRSSATA